MRRKMYDKLLEWKKRNGTSALLVQGARRVGKSYIVEEFAKKEYKTYILIDFNNPTVRNVTGGNNGNNRAKEHFRCSGNA